MAIAIYLRAARQCASSQDLEKAALCLMAAIELQGLAIDNINLAASFEFIGYPVPPKQIEDILDSLVEAEYISPPDELD